MQEGDGAYGTGAGLCVLFSRRKPGKSAEILTEKSNELGYVPICPRFVFSPFLEESDAEDMQGYGRMSHILLRRCRMVVVCGKEVTGTMNTEISMADRLHIICTTLDGLVQIKESK